MKHFKARTDMPILKKKIQDSFRDRITSNSSATILCIAGCLLSLSSRTNQSHLSGRMCVRVPDVDGSHVLRLSISLTGYRVQVSSRGRCPLA
ncbi:hypothetical protein RRG08_048510 [Elysia crispata]|uniref:Uncharacterized protein n=1 Tax=Elysia crispata TaxID=231223 RepID=A0AAE0YFE8_9GAST|nr:hypothetical protein RRG08_048510 [Elysia crispata]